MVYHRPKLHLTAHKGWMNDPNGFVYAFGKYHLFGQSNPESLGFGLMRWAHYVSSDLLSWEYVGDAISPEEAFEKPLGCFSGSSYFDSSRLHVYYTAASEGKQQQCYAFSDDGIHFKKHPGNPILGEKDLPSGYLVSDFRDPKVLMHNGKPYLLLSCRRRLGGSSILLFEGDDYACFRFKSVLFTMMTASGGMIECPDFFFSQGNEGALIFSMQYYKANDPRYYQNVHSTCYLKGILDLEKGYFLPESEIHEVDQGFDFYALQTTYDGKRVLGVAWEGMWDRNYPSSVDGYCGNFTAVRELCLDGEKLIQSFPQELDAKAKETLSLPSIRNASGRKAIPALNGDCCRLRFKARPGEGARIDLLSDNPESALRIAFEKEKHNLLISRVGMKESIVNVDHSSSVSHYVHMPEGLGEVSFDILLDGTAVDILINGGRHSFSTLFYPSLGKAEFALEGEMEIDSIRKDTF